MALNILAVQKQICGWMGFLHAILMGWQVMKASGLTHHKCIRTLPNFSHLTAHRGQIWLFSPICVFTSSQLQN